MKKALLTFIATTILFTLTVSAKDEDNVKIYGVVTYFDGIPVVEGDVFILNDSFQPVYTAKTNAQGEYEVEVKRGRYMAFATVKDYGVKNTEFWAWNLLAFEDTEINARIDKLEVYGINAFMVQGTPSHVIYVYFRPMSLERYKVWKNKPKEERESEDVEEMAPRLKVEDISVMINGEAAEIFLLNKVLEQSSEKKMIAYFVQVKPPDNWKTVEQMKIQVTIKDSETGEQGEGCLFWKRECLIQQ